MRLVHSAVFAAEELERVEDDEMVVFASGGPLMTCHSVTNDEDGDSVALCSWRDEDGAEHRHWFDVRTLRMLVPFDVKRFAS